MKFKITIDTYIFGGAHRVKIEEHPEGLTHFFNDLTTDPCLIEAEFNKNQKFFTGKVYSNEFTKYLKEGSLSSSAAATISFLALEAGRSSAGSTRRSRWNR